MIDLSQVRNPTNPWLSNSPPPPLPPTHPPTHPPPPPKEIGNLNSIITHDHHNLNNYIQNLPFLYDTKSEYIPIQNPLPPNKKKKKKCYFVKPEPKKKKTSSFNFCYVCNHSWCSLRPSVHPAAPIHQQGSRGTEDIINSNITLCRLVIF